ncbi:MAG: type II secretion system protein GspN, partial [Desulfamplus sp.]|nr:type II secretion system protein GspN [Desulfamplus sp.]
MTLKRVFFYFVYGLAVFIFFVFFLFPGERVALILCDKINTTITNGHAVMENVKPVFPLGLRAENPAILFDDGNEIRMEFITVYPEILSLYKDVKQIKVKALALGGNIDGMVALGIPESSSFPQLSSSQKESSASQLTDESSNDEPLNIVVTMQFEDIDIKDWRHTVENIDILASFKIGGYIDYSGAVKKIITAGAENIISGSGSG